MPLQKKLIQANEAGPWNSNNRQINFTIPPSIDIVDLSQSSIVLDIVITDGSTGNALGLYDAQFSNQYDARCLINSIKVSTNKGGLVEEIQNSNVLSQNLLNYNKSTELIKSQSWLGQGQTFSDYGPFLTRNSRGSTVSLQQCAIPIPFKNLIGVGNQQQWLNGNFDGTNIEVNLEYYASTVAGLFEQVLLEDVPCNAITDGTLATTAIVQTASANNNCAIPWYVGEPVMVNYDRNWTPINITGATNANPCVITLAQSPSNMLIANGNYITIAGLTGGWTGANGNWVVANLNDGAKTLELTGVNSSAYGAWTNDGTGVKKYAVSITAGSNANPAVITLQETPTLMGINNGDTIVVSGFTGDWEVANGEWVVSAKNDGAKTVALTGLNTSGLGGIAGTSVAYKKGTTYVESNHTIESIAISTTNIITITLDSKWYDNVYYGCTNVELNARASGATDANLSYKINDAQLSLVQQIPLPSQLSAYKSILNQSIDIPFYAWNVERVNMPTIGAGMKYVKLIDLLPNCRQVFIMVPLPASTDPLTSDRDDQAQYQFSLDTVYTTSRAIVPLDSLYYNNLINGFSNGKQPLNSLFGSTIWAQSVPVDGMSHQLQYEFTQSASRGGSANKVMYVFQCIDKVMNTKSAMVVNA